MSSRNRARALTESDLLKTVDLVYAAATEPETWPGVLARLNELTSSEITTLLVHDFRAQSGNSLWHAGGDPALIAEYEAWAPKNVYMPRAGALPVGIVTQGEALVPDREVMSTDYFNGYLRRVGVLHHLGTVLAREETFGALLLLLRRLGEPSHSADHESFITRLVPHVQRAVSIHRRLHGIDLRRAAAEHTLDRLAFGIVFVDERGYVIFFNRAAREILDRADGLVLGSRGQLSARRPTEASRLSRLIGEACETGAGRSLAAGGALRISGPPGKRDLAVLVAPLRVEPPVLVAQRPFAAVFINDPERGFDRLDAILRELYGFTAAEATVACLLLEGLKVEEITDRLEVSTATVRTHVRRLLEKTDTRGQADLVRILFSGPATLLLRDACKTNGR